MSRLVKRIKKCAACSALSRQNVLASVRVREGGHSGLLLQRCPKCGYTSYDISRVCEASVRRCFELKMNGRLGDPTAIEVKRKGGKVRFIRNSPRKKK